MAVGPSAAVRPAPGRRCCVGRTPRHAGRSWFHCRRLCAGRSIGRPATAACAPVGRSAHCCNRRRASAAARRQYRRPRSDPAAWRRRGWLRQSRSTRPRRRRHLRNIGRPASGMSWGCRDGDLPGTASRRPAAARSLGRRTSSHTTHGRWRRPRRCQEYGRAKRYRGHGSRWR